MKDKLTDVGIIVIFTSIIAMTMQESFQFGYGIAAGVAIAWFGLIKGKSKK